MSNRRLPLVLLCLAGVVGAEPKRDRFGDPLPEGAIARLGDLRLRHHTSVEVGDFSPDGKIFAAYGGGREIICWDTTSGRQVRRVPVAFSGWADHLRYSPDGKKLIFVGGRTHFSVFDPVTGAERVKLEQRMPRHPYNDPHAVDLSRDGTTAVTVYLGKILVVWDLIKGKRLGELKIQTDLERSAFQALALTTDGKRLVLPHKDGSLYLADVESGEELLAFEMSPDSTRNGPPRVTISPNGRYLAYGGSAHGRGNAPYRRVTLCDMRTGKRLREFSSKKSFNRWTFTPNSRSLATHEGNTIHLYDLASGKETSSFLAPSGSHELIFSRDGRQFASFWGTCILLYDVVAGRLVHAPVGHPWFLRQIHFSSDGKRLVSHTSMRGEMIVWDLASARPVATHCSGKLQHWIMAADNGEEIYFLPTTQQLPQGESDEPRFGSTKNANGKSPRFAEPDTLKIYCWRWKSDRVQQQIVAKTSRVYDEFVRSPNGRRGQNYSGITYSADARCVVLSEKRLCIREVASGKDRLQLSAGGRRALSPNGRFLACTGQGGGVRVFSTATGKVLASWHSEEGTSEAAAFSSDSRLLATGGYDGTLLLWKVPETDGLPSRLSVEEAATFWQMLADRDAVRANRALAGLTAAPTQAIPLIKARFPTTWKHPNGKQIARWIAELDDDSFPIREQATSELSQTGSEAAAALRQALAKKPSPEAKRRITGILSRLEDGPSPRYLCALRALEVLERIGTSQARDVLRELADKPLSPELHAEIQASLQRLKTRP